VSPGQINFLMPSGLATGVATFTITGSPGAPLKAIGAVGQVAPAIFSMDDTGSGVAAATAIRVPAANPTSPSPVPVFDCGVPPCQAVPIDVSTPSVYLTLYATGIRHRDSLDLDHISVIVNGLFLPVLYAGPQPSFAGLDQINVALPAGLGGSGLTNVVVKVNQHQANLVTVAIK
jgi:uncharacterized protein (TIGR03437 family)